MGWIAYDSYVAPIGDRRADYQAAVISHTIHMENAFRESKDKCKSLDPFLLSFDSVEKERTPLDNAKRAEKMLLALFGKKPPEKE